MSMSTIPKRRALRVGVFAYNRTKSEVSRPTAEDQLLDYDYSPRISNKTGLKLTDFVLNMRRGGVLNTFHGLASQTHFDERSP